MKRLLPQCVLADQVRLGTRLAQALRESRRGGRLRWPLDRWIREAKGSIALRERRAAIRPGVSYPPELPITLRKEEIVDAIRRHPVVIVAGETGSGKTTQLPKMCLEAGLGCRARIGCTQPRRVAALSISRRVAAELGATWGREVGCKIRFTDRSRPETSIKVMTDGILLAEIQGDPLLAEYEAVVLDEAHERSLNIDFLLGYFRGLLTRRDDLKLIITSATIDTERFSNAFGGAPVIQVSGRLYPVEVRYRPLDPEAEEQGEITSVDAAVTAVAELAGGSTAGDILVFMPGERDIRETCDRLRSRHGDGLEVIPMFGRLTAPEQERVFSPGPRQRVVVATNIAETSLTVPRIRYVVDSGLARISRYQPSTRCRRLPIEPVSRSSADQRQGRCGRLAAGVCVRLYSPEDYRKRPLYPEPELQRCNLADVILRIKAYRLGEIETFPFIDPPGARAVRTAYALLEELGALDAQRELTSLGHELARLPVDPSIGRMILEARAENALTEVLVIAAGLSVQDPRERPLDRREEAEAAHRRFQHPRSDFLTLLNMWNVYHDSWDALKTQSQLRKFCRAHYLSFARMREWRDIHGQLSEALAELEGVRPNVEPAAYAEVHRCILTGLWGHVARREEGNTFQVAGGRQVWIFPGSGLFQRASGRLRGRPGARATEADDGAARAARWIVAGELVETTRPYARTVAAIEPEWIIDLAPHLCRTTYDDLRWDRDSGRVLATERVSFRGLLVRERAVPYDRADPEAARSVFIREGLIGCDLSGAYRFLERNRQLCQKIEIWQTRLRERPVPDVKEALFGFYDCHLGPVASEAALRRRLGSQRNPDFLCARPADLLGEHARDFDAAAFPDSLSVGDEVVPVTYDYSPGGENDGVTVRLTYALAEVVDPARLEWAVPALREGRVLELLRALPKGLRRGLMPLAATAREMVSVVDVETPSYLAAMSEFVRRFRGVAIPVEAWSVDQLPAHLRPRFEIMGEDRHPLASGRDLRQLRDQLRRRQETQAAARWEERVARWEKFDLRDWDFGDLPERLSVGEVAGLPWHGYPGLQTDGQDVHLRVFRTPEDAQAASCLGIPRLAETVLSRELGWLAKDLRALDKLKPLYVTLGPGTELTETAWTNLRAFLFPEPTVAFRTAAEFRGYVDRARQKMPGLAMRLTNQVEAILKKRQETVVCRHPLALMRAEIDALVPPRFLEQTPFERLRDVPRYLQALLIRADRAALNPAKDAEKARRVQPFLTALAELERLAGLGKPGREKVDSFRRLVEEFKVSVFAQELGTAVPVSEKRLNERYLELSGKRQR